MVGTGVLLPAIRAAVLVRVGQCASSLNKPMPGRGGGERAWPWTVGRSDDLLARLAGVVTCGEQTCDGHRAGRGRQPICDECLPPVRTHLLSVVGLNARVEHELFVRIARRDLCHRVDVADPVDPRTPLGQADASVVGPGSGAPEPRRGRRCKERATGPAWPAPRRRRRRLDPVEADSAAACGESHAPNRS
jgi:hypothetical protein